MKAKRFVAALSILIASGSAFAQQSEYVAPDAGFKSTKTRAEVRAELEEAYKQGWRPNAQSEFEDIVTLKPAQSDAKRKD